VKYIVTCVVRYDHNEHIDFQKNSKLPNKSEIKFGVSKYVIRKSRHIVQRHARYERENVRYLMKINSINES